MRRPRRLIGLVVAIFFLLVVASAVDLLVARSHLTAGASELSSAIHLIGGTGGVTNGQLRQELVAKVSAAHDNFAAAETDLWPLSPLLGRLGFIPKVGPEIASAYPLADAGAHVTAGTLDILNGLGPVWNVLAHRHRHTPLLRQIASLLPLGQAKFRSARTDFEIARIDLRSVPASLGYSSLDAQIRRLRRAVGVMLSTTKWLQLSPHLLGDFAPSQLLLVWQNPDQIRPTGGFIPATTLLTITRGKISTRPFGSYLTSNVSVPVPAPEAAYTGEGTLLFEDSNWSPDFPLSARYERWMFGAATGIRVPTIVNVAGAAAILQATGPIYVRQYHRRVDAADVAYWIEYYHLLYVHNPANVAFARRHRALSDTRSQRFLADLFSDIMGRIQSTGATGLVRLANGFHRAVEDQSILMYSRDQRVESAIQGTGADGAIGPVGHDSLLVVDDNFSYNKINPYVRENAHYRVRIARDRSIVATLRIRYHNRPSPPDLYGTGPFDGRFARHTYEDFIRVYVPAGSRLRSITGIDPCTAAGRGSGLCAAVPAYGMTEFSDGMTLPEGQTRTATFRYVIPASVFAADPNRYQLTLRRQAASNLSRVKVTVTVAPGMSVGAGSAGTFSVARRLLLARTDLSIPIAGATGSPPAMRIRSGPYSDPWLPNSLFNTPLEPF